MEFNAVIKFVQEHFTDGLVLVIGSGLSAAEGLPGMPALAEHLKACAAELEGDDIPLWAKIAAFLDAGNGLETALLTYAPSDSLEAWIVRCTCQLLLPIETEIISSVVRSERTLRLTKFLLRILKLPNGLPILTPNYDRLIEVACEMAHYHVDTTAIGTYAGAFDPSRSCMASCRGITNRGKVSVLDHFPRAVVLKPHGSFDWYRTRTGALRSSIALGAERMIITPGLNKYKAGYNTPFDKHRELANNYINQSARLLIVGYGFNDDHLQTHLLTRIQNGTPTLILTRTSNDRVNELAYSSPNCLCLSSPKSGIGVVVRTNRTQYEQSDLSLWDLGTLTEELLT